MKEERMEILLVLISILYRYVVKSYKDLKKVQDLRPILGYKC